MVCFQCMNVLGSGNFYEIVETYFLPKGHSIQVAFFQRYSRGPWVWWCSHRQHRAYWTVKMAMPTKTLPVIPICSCHHGKAAKHVCRVHTLMLLHLSGLACHRRLENICLHPQKYNIFFNSTIAGLICLPI